MKLKLFHSEKPRISKIYRAIASVLDEHEIPYSLITGGKTTLHPDAEEIDAKTTFLCYHTRFNRPNFWNVKFSYLPDYIYLDRMGFSGWASITDLDLEWFLSAPTTPERNREIDEFHQRLCERYVLPNKSKFAKQPLVECPYENYIFWFLTQMYARFSSRQVGQRRGKTLRMCSCPVRSGAVVCRSIDGRLRGPRSWWGACSAAAGSDASC